MSYKKIKVLLLGPMPPSIGGIATYLSNMLSSNLAESFDLVPFTTSRPNKEIILNKTHFLGHYFPSFVFLLMCFFVTIYHICIFPVTIIKEKPVIVHIHTASYFSFLENSLYILVSKVFQKKVILHIHGGSFLVFFRNSSDFLKLYIKYILSLSNQVICLSTHWRSCLVDEIGTDISKISVISNGYKGSSFFPMDMENCRKSLNLPSNKKIILTIGELSEIKGHKYLVEAMSKVLMYRSDVICIIIGKGDLKNKLEEQINLAGLSSYIKLIGYVPHEKIPLWINSCNIFVLPSLIEGNPTVMFEALICGKPFIGTKVGSIPEVITSNLYGVLSEPEDSNDLADKILYSLDKNWNTTQIIKYAGKFKFENIVKMISTVYLEL
jgi:Glycosyltransferase